MTHRSAVPVSSAFESIARGAQFRDRIAVVVKASPETIFQALHAVALSDFKNFDDQLPQEQRYSKNDGENGDKTDDIGRAFV